MFSPSLVLPRSVGAILTPFLRVRRIQSTTTSGGPTTFRLFVDANFHATSSSPPNKKKRKLPNRPKLFSCFFLFWVQQWAADLCTDDDDMFC